VGSPLLSWTPPRQNIPRCNVSPLLPLLWVLLAATSAAGMVKLVLQDDFSPGTGNALQACVASLFEMPLNTVNAKPRQPCTARDVQPPIPISVSCEPEPYAALHRFTATRGLGFVKVESSLLFAHLTMRLLFFYSTMRADFCSSILRCGPP
jgi:hypothetical protein